MKRRLCMLLACMMLWCGAALGEEDTVIITGEKVLQLQENTVPYIEISLGDESVAQKINEDAKAQAQQVLSQYDPAQAKVSVECTGMSLMGGEVLSLRFAGTVDGEMLAQPAQVYYTTNYSLETGERLALGDLCDLNVVAAALAGENGALTFERAEEESDAYYEAQAAYLQDLGQRTLTTMLRAADVWKDETPPQSFSYWKGDGSCVISVEMPDALGGFAHVTFAYEPSESKGEAQ